MEKMKKAAQKCVQTEAIALRDSIKEQEAEEAEKGRRKNTEGAQRGPQQSRGQEEVQRGRQGRRQEKTAERDTEIPQKDKLQISLNGDFRYTFIELNCKPTGGAGGGCPGTNRNHSLHVILSFLGNYLECKSAKALSSSFS